MSRKAEVHQCNHILHILDSGPTRRYEGVTLAGEKLGEPKKTPESVRRIQSVVLKVVSSHLDAVVLQECLFDMCQMK